jgi:hypothetical protein
MRFNNSVDDKNSILLNELESNGVQIDFENKSDFKSWAVQPRYKYGIVAPNHQANPESLAHELLHIKMNILGFIDTNTISDIFKSNNCHFATEELSTIQNILAHLRMLPEFVAMGYAMEKFVVNDGEEFYTKELLPAIIKFKIAFDINERIYKKQTIYIVTQLLKIIISIKHCEIENSFIKENRINTGEFIQLLRESDGELFDCIYQELTDWVNSGSYSNYDFYVNLNAKLFELHYPVEMEWEKWLNEIE